MKPTTSQNFLSRAKLKVALDDSMEDFLKERINQIDRRLIKGYYDTSAPYDKVTRLGRIYFDKWSMDKQSASAGAACIDFVTKGHCGDGYYCYVRADIILDQDVHDAHVKKLDDEVAKKAADQVKKDAAKVRAKALAEKRQYERLKAKFG